MEKFIIEKEDKEAVYLMYADEDGDVMVEGAYLTPYIEPDREKAAADAFQRGYEHAKHECADCRKIRADTEQELADNAYQRGLNDAWDAARKICPMDSKTRDEIFGEVITSNIVDENTASEAIDKIRQYEQEKEGFKVGDEVISDEDIKGVTIDMDDYLLHVLDENGVVQAWPREDAVKTDRYFPEIAAVLEKMKEYAT